MMKSLLLLFSLLSGVVAFAQPPPTPLMMSRFPYVPETPRETPLDIQAVMRSLPPLDLRIETPLQMPDHLQFTPGEMVWVRRLREAYQLVSKRRFTEARDVFQDFLSVYPNHAPTRVGLADVYFSMGAHHEAKQAYREFLKDHPTNFQALNNLAWLLSTHENPELRDPQEAVALARQAMVIFPDSHHVWSTLSQALYAGGNFEEATRAAVNAFNLARRANVESLVIVNYHNQIERCRSAALATSLME